MNVVSAQAIVALWNDLSTDGIDRLARGRTTPNGVWVAMFTKRIWAKNRPRRNTSLRRRLQNFISQDKDGDQLPALEVGSARLLVIPALNETSRGFPFPLLPRVARLKEGLFLRTLRTMLTIAVSPKMGRRSVTAVTGVCVKE